MSGGVDSSYAAAKLQLAGYDVVGIMLNLWTEPSQMGENRCCSLESQTLAARIADQLKIPFFIIDAKDEFHQIVVEQFIKDYLAGKTPNPCVACNSLVRWRMLLNQADKFGIQYISTGHYAKIKHRDQNQVDLYKGKDHTKDQSYVLSMLKKEYLLRTLLPLGDMTKQWVRKESEILGLKSASKPDSQDLCFLGEMNYRQFLLKYAGDHIVPGEIVTEEGAVVGSHDGLPFYTIGQRKRLRIAYPHPIYVIEKDSVNNRLIVGLERVKDGISFEVHQINWLENIGIRESLECNVKVRYRSKEIPCLIIRNSAYSCSVSMIGSHKPDVTPGQVAAFYRNDLCLGGGIIV